MPVTIGGSGPITGVTSINTTVSDTELGYLDGVTSALQSQINTAGGLVKITDQSFSAASAVNVDNCFTSTYDAYRLVMLCDAGSAAGVTYVNRVGGVNAATNYATQTLNVANTSVTAARSGSSTYIEVGATRGTPTEFIIDVFRPALAKETGLLSINRDFSSSAINFQMFSGNHTTATAYDGFSLSGTNLTGTIRVYGYRN